MKRFANQYYLVHDFNNLYRAYLAARKGKRNKREIIEFESLLGGNLHDLKIDLMNKRYYPGSYYIFTIKEPKERIIMTPKFRDRIVQHSLCDNVLRPIFERHFINSTFANRLNKGTHAALGLLGKQMNSTWREAKNGYILKCDISKYFYSIDHEIMKDKVRRVIKDKELLWLIDTIIDSVPGRTGIPIGNLTSQYLANYFLSDMDHLIKEKLRIKHYVRYMDDFTLIHPDKEYLNFCKDYLTYYLNENSLSFNKKTQLFPIKNGADFLGFHTYVTESGKIVRKLRRKSKQNIKRKLRYFQKRYKLGDMDLNKIKASITSWINHASYGNTYNLRRRVLEKYTFEKGRAP